MFFDPGNYQSNPGCTCGSGRTSRSTASYHQSMSTTHGDAYHRWKHWCLVSVTTRYCFLGNCVFLSQTLPVFDCSLLDRFLYRFKAAPSKLAAFGHAGRLICWLVNNIAMTPVFFIPLRSGMSFWSFKEIPCASGCPKGLTCNPNTEQLGAEYFSLNGSPFSKPYSDTQAVLFSSRERERQPQPKK